MSLHSETEIYRAVVDLQRLVLRQATHSHHTRCRAANTLRRRGLSVDHRITKVYA